MTPGDADLSPPQHGGASNLNNLFSILDDEVLSDALAAQQKQSDEALLKATNDARAEATALASKTAATDLAAAEHRLKGELTADYCRRFCQDSQILTQNLKSYHGPKCDPR